MRQIMYFNNSEFLDDYSELECFSIVEDLKISKLPIDKKYSNLKTDFTDYMKKGTVKDKELQDLDKLFVSKLNELFTEAREECSKGKKLSTVLNIKDKDELDKIKDLDDVFSVVAKESSTGSINKSSQDKLSTAYKSFVEWLRRKIFLPKKDTKVSMKKSDTEKIKNIIKNKGL